MVGSHVGSAMIEESREFSLYKCMRPFETGRMHEIVDLEYLCSLFGVTMGFRGRQLEIA